jgi:hypothetical protein
VSDLDRHGVAPVPLSRRPVLRPGQGTVLQHVPAKRRRALGHSFNIASYAMLTCMIAQVCDLRPGDLSIKMGIVTSTYRMSPSFATSALESPRPFPYVAPGPDDQGHR